MFFLSTSSDVLAPTGYEASAGFGRSLLVLFIPLIGPVAWIATSVQHRKRASIS